MKQVKNACMPVMVIAACCMVWAACNPVQPSLHEIRMKNNYPQTFEKVKIGALNFGTLQTGSLTAYKQITAGTYQVSGECDPNGKLTGELTFEGEGLHQWTVVIAASGYLTMVDDSRD